MATVYLARDLLHDRPIALKVLRPELAHALGPERAGYRVLMEFLHVGKASGRLKRDRGPLRARLIPMRAPSLR
jgi:hypothetical protein